MFTGSCTLVAVLLRLPMGIVTLPMHNGLMIARPQWPLSMQMSATLDGKLRDW